MDGKRIWHEGESEGGVVETVGRGRTKMTGENNDFVGLDKRGGMRNKRGISGGERQKVAAAVVVVVVKGKEVAPMLQLRGRMGWTCEIGQDPKVVPKGDEGGKKRLVNGEDRGGCNGQGQEVA